MSKSFALWYPEINPDITNVPYPALKEAVRAAAIKFCNKTHLWKVELDPIDIVADQSDYTLTVPTELEADIIVVDDVQYKAEGEDDDKYQTVYPVSFVQKNLNTGGGWRFSNIESITEYYVDPEDVTTLHLVGNPSEASTDGLLVTVIIKPIRIATALPDFIYDDYREEIGCGAKANLFLRKGMPWYDPKIADYYKNEFDNACNNGKLTRVKGGTNMNLSVKMRPMV